MSRLGIFHEPGAWLAQGLKAGGQFHDHPADLAARLKASGFKWVVQEYGDPATQPDDATIATFRSACHEHALYYGGWGRGVDQELMESAHANFWVFDVESDYTDYQVQLANIRDAHPLLPLGVVTDCGLNARPFINHNVKAMPMAYGAVPGQDPNTTPANMTNRCRAMGWLVVFPVLGVFDGGTLASYTRAGDGWSVYYCEGMTDADWQTAAQWDAA